ncbi:hypothetical protein [Micromonospora tulbaghiae]
MPLIADPFQYDVARIALTAAVGHGFALAGGQALVVHGVVNRPTEDVGLFTDIDGGVTAAAELVHAALRDAGYQVDLTEDEAHDALRRLDRLTDAVFALYPLTPSQIDGLRKAFADWPRT